MVVAAWLDWLSWLGWLGCPVGAWTRHLAVALWPFFERHCFGKALLLFGGYPFPQELLEHRCQ